MPRPVDDVAPDDAALIGRHRRKLRGVPHCIAADINIGIGTRAQVLVYLDAAFAMHDDTRPKIEALDIGHASRAINGPISVNTALHAIFREAHPQSPVGRFDLLDPSLGMDADGQPLALGTDLGNGILVEAPEELWQCLEDGDLNAGARIDVAQFEGDNAAANKNHGARQHRIVQHIVGCG